MSQTYDLVIIGGGPAGVSAGVYAARKKLNTLFITESFDSQSTVSTEIQNWIGTIKISGRDLSKNLEAHLRAYASDILTIKTKEKVTTIKKSGDDFIISTNKGEYRAKTILLTTGASRKKIEAKGADVFEHKGLTYCATCDGPLFADMDVIVIGGGNAAFETASELAAYCKSVTMIQRSRRYRADETTVEKVLANSKIKSVVNHSIEEVIGDKFVTGLRIKDKETGVEKTLPAKGIFVEIGSVPATDLVRDLVKLNENQNVIVDPKTQMTSHSRIWAAGDCTDGLYAQNNIAVGDAIKAVENIYRQLKA